MWTIIAERNISKGEHINIRSFDISKSSRSGKFTGNLRGMCWNHVMSCHGVNLFDYCAYQLRIWLPLKFLSVWLFSETFSSPEKGRLGFDYNWISSRSISKSVGLRRNPFESWPLLPLPLVFLARALRWFSRVPMLINSPSLLDWCRFVRLTAGFVGANRRRMIRLFGLGPCPFWIAFLSTWL